MTGTGDYDVAKTDGCGPYDHHRSLFDGCLFCETECRKMRIVRSHFWGHSVFKRLNLRPVGNVNYQPGFCIQPV